MFCHCKAFLHSSFSSLILCDVLSVSNVEIFFCFLISQKSTFRILLLRVQTSILVFTSHQPPCQISSRVMPWSAWELLHLRFFLKQKINPRPFVSPVCQIDELVEWACQDSWQSPQLLNSRFLYGFLPFCIQVLSWTIFEHLKNQIWFRIKIVCSSFVSLWSSYRIASLSFVYCANLPWLLLFSFVLLLVMCPRFSRISVSENPSSFWRRVLFQNWFQLATHCAKIASLESLILWFLQVNSISSFGNRARDKVSIHIITFPFFTWTVVPLSCACSKFQIFKGIAPLLSSMFHFSLKVLRLWMRLLLIPRCFPNQLQIIMIWYNLLLVLSVTRSNSLVWSCWSPSGDYLQMPIWKTIILISKPLLRAGGMTKKKNRFQWTLLNTANVLFWFRQLWVELIATFFIAKLSMCHPLFRRTIRRGLLEVARPFSILPRLSLVITLPLLLLIVFLAANLDNLDWKVSTISTGKKLEVCCTTKRYIKTKSKSENVAALNH